MRTHRHYLFGCSIALVSALTGCLTNNPDPALGGIYACVEDSDCPGSQTCLQQLCEAIELPAIQILNPEDEEPYAFGSTHAEVLSISGNNLILRQLSASNEAVPGEGHMVVFIDEVEQATIDTGDITAGIQIPIEIPDTPGVHRIRVQVRLNDGTDYDNESAHARNLVWVDDGRKHVALRKPWPGETFGLDAQSVQAEVTTFDPNGMVEIGPPGSGAQHVHIYYDEQFPACFDDSICINGQNGVVPSKENQFGPLLLPASAAGMVTLTAVIAETDHMVFKDEMDQPVFSEIRILRSDNQ